MITIKSDREIELMREAGYMVSKTHKYLKPFIKEGITTKELDKLAEEYRALAKNEENVIFGGRLAEYKYYDMDDVIKSAFNKMYDLNQEEV